MFVLPKFRTWKSDGCGARVAGGRILLSLLVMAALAGTPAGASVDKGRSAAYLNSAQEYIKKGDQQSAIIELKNAIQSDPGNVAARELLGGIYLNTRQYPAAEKELKAARRRGSKNPKLILMLGRAYMAQRKFDAVLREVKDDVASGEARAEALYLRGRAFLALKRVKEAADAFREADRLNPAEVRARVGMAQTRLFEGKTEEAERDADVALSRNPKSPEALLLKGALRRRSRDPKAAVGYFDQAIALEPNFVRARLSRAAALIDLKRGSDAMADLNAVFRVAPGHPLALYLMALARTQLRDYSGAYEALQSAGERLRNHPPSIFLNGAVSFALNKHELAIRHLTRYVEMDPNNSRARRLLAAAHVRKREPRRAIEVLTYFTKRGELDAQVLTLLGSAHMQLGRFDEGTSYFERAAESAPEAVGVRTQLALGRLVQGRPDNAVSELEQALVLDPQSHRAAILLALVHMRERKFDKALAAARKLQKLMPGNPLPSNLIGAAQLGMGNPAEARKTFEETLRRNPSYHSARIQIARLDLRDGRLDRAELHYSTILEKNPKHMGAMMGMAQLAMRQETHGKAVEWLRKAATANPKSPTPRLRLIAYYLSRKEFRRASSEARALNQALPNNPQVVAVLAKVEGAAGDHVAAVDAYRRLAALKPNSVPVLIEQAQAEVRSKNPAAARKTLQRAVELDGDAAVRALAALVRFEISQKNFSEAQRQAEKIRVRMPKSAEGDLLVGDILMGQERHADALSAYSRGLKKQSAHVLAIRRYRARLKVDGQDRALSELRKWVNANKSPTGRLALAVAYMGAQKNKDAIREFEKLEKASKENPVVLNNLAWLYFISGDGRALEFAQRANKLAPKSPAIMDTLGWILLDKGQNHRALVLLRRASGLAPNHAEIRYHLAVALHRTGDTGAARRELEALLKAKPKFSSVEDAKALLKKLRTR